MGWQDRDYRNQEYADGGSVASGLRRPPIGVLTLMILHGLAFLLMLMLRAEEGGETVPLVKLVDLQAHAAGILLHPFATDSLFSTLFVLLAFWSLGGRLEHKLGPARVLALYVLGNLVAGVVYFAVARLNPALAGAALDYPAGALAAMCVAAWVHLRHEAVQVLGRVTTFARMYAVCAAIVVGLVLLRTQQGALAWIVAAAAGAASGLLVERVARLGLGDKRRARQTARPSMPRSRVRRRPPEDPDVDEILAKISRAGIESLTPAERERLEAARRAKLRQR